MYKVLKYKENTNLGGFYENNNDKIITAYFWINWVVIFYASFGRVLFGDARAAAGCMPNLQQLFFCLS